MKGWMTKGAELDDYSSGFFGYCLVPGSLLSNGLGRDDKGPINGLLLAKLVVVF